MDYKAPDGSDVTGVSFAPGYNGETPNPAFIAAPSVADLNKAVSEESGSPPYTGCPQVKRTLTLRGKCEPSEKNKTLSAIMDAFAAANPSKSWWGEWQKLIPRWKFEKNPLP